MKLILLSGGSGQRLWPLSNDFRSKQFLKVLDNGDGQYESMIQRIWRQLGQAGLQKEVCFVANSSQTEIIRFQVNDHVQIIEEPARKDTFPAIALAVLYLLDRVKMDPNETVCVLPVDSYVEDRFFQHLPLLDRILENPQMELALMGAKPTYPSAKYGYILTGRKEGTYYWVEKFIEKPSEAVAAQLIKRQALWNCGVFAFRGRYIPECLKRLQLPASYEAFIAGYLELQGISFDYAVAEKAQRIAVLPYDGYWKDLGTWNTLTEEIHTSVIGRGMISEDCENTHVLNELDVPVKVLGISNAVIAVSSDGILVTDKSASPRLKEMLKDDPRQRARYVERSWGWYQIMDVTQRERRETIVRRLTIWKNREYTERLHQNVEEVITVISGQGIIQIDNQTSLLQSGDVYQIRAATKRLIRAMTDLQCVQIQFIPMV